MRAASKRGFPFPLLSHLMCCSNVGVFIQYCIASKAVG